MQRILIHILSRAIVVTVFIIAVAVGALASTEKIVHGRWRLPSAEEVAEKLRGVVNTPAKPSKVIYLHRARLQVQGGEDDARARLSSLVPDGEVRKLPRYRSSDAVWRRLTTCVENKFAAYDVVVTDKLPENDSYILVKVGGKAADLGRDNTKLGGIAPYNQQAIPNSIVFAFDQGGKFRTKNNCEAIAHEVGHVYGLDHTYKCDDVMSYQRGCGPKVFVDKAMACGEKDTRLCEDGLAEQNSGDRLLRLLGKRRVVQ